jgi:hypothetical protein
MILTYLACGHDVPVDSGEVRVLLDLGGAPAAGAEAGRGLLVEQGLCGVGGVRVCVRDTRE